EVLASGCREPAPLNLACTITPFRSVIFAPGQCTPSRVRFRANRTLGADLLQEYEAKIAALERMVGRQALEIEFLKGALRNTPRPRSVNTSVIAGPAASPSQKDAG